MIYGDILRDDRKSALKRGTPHSTMKNCIVQHCAAMSTIAEFLLVLCCSNCESVVIFNILFSVYVIVYYMADMLSDWT